MAEVESVTAPEISQEDLSSFKSTHFGQVSTEHFSHNFLGPVDEYYEGDEETADDGLGYYPDGVKRTLTDEQIAIFRHSEIQAILRDRRHKKEAREDSSEIQIPDVENGLGEIEDGECEDHTPTSNYEVANTSTPPTSQAERKLSNNQRKKLLKAAKKKQKECVPKQKSFYKQHIKPDLRKRTWDKVDSGMESLAYDDEPAGSSAATQALQRRRISYDD